VLSQIREPSNRFSEVVSTQISTILQSRRSGDDNHSMGGARALMAARQFFENAVRSATHDWRTCGYSLARFQPEFLGVKR